MHGLLRRRQDENKMGEIGFSPTERNLTARKQTRYTVSTNTIDWEIFALDTFLVKDFRLK